MYNEVLKSVLPEWAKLIGFAVDLAALIMARTVEQAKGRVAHVTSLVNNWLEKHGLSLAASKTEVVVLTRQRHYGDTVRFHITREAVDAVKAIRYLLYVAEIWADALDVKKYQTRMVLVF